MPANCFKIGKHGKLIFEICELPTKRADLRRTVVSVVSPRPVIINNYLTSEGATTGNYLHGKTQSKNGQLSVRGHWYAFFFLPFSGE